MNARSEIFAELDEIDQLRVPPHSVEAESSLLGGLLLDNRAWDRVGDLLVESDFYRHEHRLIFSAIRELINANKPADVVTVFDKVQAAGSAADLGGMAYLNALAQYVPSATNIRRYAEIVRERGIRRRLISASDEIATMAFSSDGNTVEGILDAAQQSVFGIAESQVTARDDWEGADVGIVSFLDSIQRAYDGEEEDFAPTGLKDLDEKMDGGMRTGEVIVIAGRPSMGKTALAMTIGENVAEGGEVVGFLSMEMPRTQVNRRRVAMRSGVPLHKMKRPKRMSDYDWSQMSATADKVRKDSFFVSDQTGLNINQVRLKARKLKRRSGLRLLIVDYIGLMEGTDKKANRATQLGEVSRGMKSLAKELDCTILLLAQLNREVEKRPNQRPIMSDLRECGDIEQDADIIFFVHRPIHAKPDLGAEWKRYAEIIVGKQRDGESGAVVDMQYAGESFRFFDWKGERPSSLVRTKGGEL